MLTQRCKSCNQYINYNHWREFACHCASCKSNPNVISKYKKGQDTLRKIRFRYYTIICPKCNKKFTLCLTQNAFNRGKYRHYCSNKCAKSRKQTEEINERRRKTIMHYLSEHNYKPIKRELVCLNCNRHTETDQRDRRIKFCSGNCYKEYRHKEAVDKWGKQRAYYVKCKFKFNVWDFPNEFDLSLIYHYGFYKAKNKGDNQNGVSRDHMVSIKYGFKHNIDPTIISHPANCKLIRHKENMSKSKKCSITLIQLIDKINEWNKKYNYGPVVITETHLSCNQV